MTPDEKVNWMRSMGALQAQWFADGGLAMCVLGPKPSPEPSEDDGKVEVTAENYEDLLCASA